MALEYAPNKIRINAVAPTAIATDMVKEYIAASENKEEARAIAANVNPLVGPGSIYCTFTELYVFNYR